MAKIVGGWLEQDGEAYALILQLDTNEEVEQAIGPTEFADWQTTGLEVRQVTA